MHANVSSNAHADPAPRRSFIVRFAAVVTGTLAALFPFAAGWGVLTDPWRHGRRASTGNGKGTASLVRICPLDALTADATPRQFAVTQDVTDAWTHEAAERIGAVYLTRSDKNPGHVTALSATCPHLGCSVEFDATKSEFKCPCHASWFNKDGQKLSGPSRRGLDPLPVKIVDDTGTKEIWIEFERFEAGIAERKPVG
ncbi:MAG TPA: ubiquinol-cytochrome c reductase iron-sulfur subunit [Lacipirellulaceae bacterium]|nr:ubiquinol-cytochrome c reductase iron-sulfur subunit [Lacipirellulaceae bacterium]